jgi:hypothetical protein
LGFVKIVDEKGRLRDIEGDRTWGDFAAKFFTTPFGFAYGALMISTAVGITCLITDPNIQHENKKGKSAKEKNIDTTALNNLRKAQKSAHVSIGDFSDSVLKQELKSLANDTGKRK